MTRSDSFATAPLGAYLAKLDRRFKLAPEDCNAILALPAVVHSFEAHRTIVKEGQVANEAIFLVEGLVSRQRLVNKQRQIISLNVAGDAIDLQTLFFRDADNALVTHQKTIIASVPHGSLIELCSRAPLVAQLLWHDTLVDSAIFREWAMNVGHRRATERIGAFLLELEARLAAIGQVKDHTFELPLAQQEIASALGLSLVHMNKSLRKLREAGLINTRGRAFQLVDPARLKEEVGFDSAYLYLHEPPAFQKPTK